MSLTKLTCPDCGTTMRPKVPVAPGKKVRCPKCQTVFAAADEDPVEVLDDEEEYEEKPRKKKKAKAAAAKAEPKPQKEEEEVYGYKKEEEDDEEAAEAKKINYAPDESIRDLRGPAIVKLRAPTGYLTLCGFLGAGGWLLFILLMAIPFSFPIPEDKPKDDPNRPAQKDEKGQPKRPEKSTFHIWWQLDFYNGVINRWDNPALFWAIIFGFLMLALYSGLIAFGSIKLINLESRVWGIVASVMAMLPINTAGLTFAIAFGVQFGLRQIEIEEEAINYLTIGIGVLLWLISLALGIWTLIVANDAVVKEGFAYEPE